MDTNITRRRALTIAAAGLAATASFRFATPSRAAGKKIAVVPKTLINDVFQIQIAEAAEKAAATLGIETERFASTGDVAVQDQINILEALIARGEFGGIVLAPTVPKGLGAVVQKAKDAGIFVVLVDNATDGEGYVTAIKTDNKTAASVGADFAAKLIAEKGKVAMLEGEPGGPNAILRTDGFHEGLKKYPAIELVTSITGHWTLPGGVEATEAIIAEHKDLDLVFAASDMMGVGARQVLDRAAAKAESAGDADQAKKFRDVKIVGFDGVAEAVQQIWAGKFSGTVAQRPAVMGEKAVEILAALMKGEKQASDFPKEIDSGMVLVTPENVDAYAKEIGAEKRS